MFSTEQDENGFPDDRALWRAVQAFESAAKSLERIANGLETGPKQYRSEKGVFTVTCRDARNSKRNALHLAGAVALALAFGGQGLAADGLQRTAAYTEALKKPVSAVAKTSPGNDRLSAQYAVMAVCQAAGVPYQWDKSQELAGAGARTYVEPVSIEDIPAGTAISDILRPIGLTYGVDDNGVYLCRPTVHQAKSDQSKSTAAVAARRTAGRKPAVPAADTEAVFEKSRYKYTFVDGDYMRLPDFDLRYENSRRGEPLPNAAKYYDETEVSVDHGALKGVRRQRGDSLPTVETTKTRRLPDAVVSERERRWATQLPSLAVGEFGAWPEGERLEVFQVIGPDDMLMKCGQVMLRFKGWPTGRFFDEQDLGSPSITLAIIDTWTYRTALGSTKTVLMAIPLDKVRRGLSKEEFRQMSDSGIQVQ